MAPPPPPICFPFIGGSKPKRRLSWSSSDRSQAGGSHPEDHMIRRPSYSPTSTLTTAADSLAFHSDSEKYDEVPSTLPKFHKDGKGRPKIVRSNTMTGTKKSTGTVKWGYGWGVGKKQKDKEMEKDLPDMPHSMSQINLPLYQSPVRSNSKSTQASRSTQKTQDTHRTQDTLMTQETYRTQDTSRSHNTHRSKSTTHTRSGDRGDGDRATTSRRPQVYPNDSSSTLVGSALERKLNEVDSIRGTEDTTERLEDLRRNMATHDLDYYIIPSEDAHGTEYVAESDKRREYISGFLGTAGQAIVTKTSAYLFTDSRYWLQARKQLDRNWTLVRAGAVGESKDWIDWLLENARDARIGFDARMISHEKATLINSKIAPLNSKLIFPPQNLVDLIWKDKPPKSKAPIFIQPVEFAGVDAKTKLNELRDWIRQQAPSVPSYSRNPATPAQMQVGTLVTSLSGIAYILNLRGSDIPHNPLFHAYLFVGLDSAVIFLDSSKVTPDTMDYLKGLHVERREYLDFWTFLRRREWGEGKLLISPQASYAISLMLTHYRYTVAPSFVEQMLSVKNKTEIDGLKRAYLRDGASFVRFLAWLEFKLSEGYDITEYEAASRLTEFRRHNRHFMGLAYKSISATGANAALPHYTPRKATAHMIERDTPYLNDSGGQYRDGTCDTTRTVHFGRPTTEQSEAFTRVLQGHIAIDSAIFPEGTSGHQLDVLARKALWKDGLNYMHGTGHGFGSFLTVHEGPQSFSSSIPLVPGHVITNEPGFYNEGKWGMRIESALVVRHVDTKGEFNGHVWLGFERLTCVPIQTRMVRESMLTKEEIKWIKEHNQRCLEKLTPLLKDDKRAFKWLKREAERGIGVAAAPGGITIDWD